MATRPPADAIVALRSLERRFRGLFAGLGEDESPDDVAHRKGADGRSALEHVVAATGAVEAAGRDLERALLEDEPTVPGGTGADAGPATGTVEDRLRGLAAATTAVAERADRVGAREWARTAQRADDGTTVTAAALLWAGVDRAVEHLKAAERTLAEVRRRR